MDPSISQAGYTLGPIKGLVTDRVLMLLDNFFVSLSIKTHMIYQNKVFYFWKGPTYSVSFSPKLFIGQKS